MANLNSHLLLENKQAFAENLRAWYQKNHRKLPWRTHPSLYKTVVSEFMLQQTQVTTVLPYFDRWLEHFPNFQALANTPEESVLKYWEGLGYYTRARNLHKLAKAIVLLKEIPETAVAWQKFPGVGPYTAAAIASIAFGDPIPVIDGNVIRILARLTSCDVSFGGSSQAHDVFSVLAHEIIDVKDPNTHNQAMMELGATICTRQNAKCGICPVKSFSHAGLNNTWANFPKIQKKQITKLSINRGWVVHNNKLLLHYISENEKRLANIYELPASDDFISPDTLSTYPLLLKKNRSISTQRITESIYHIPPTPNLLKAITKNADLQWIPLNQLHEITLSGPHRRWVNAIQAAV